MIELNKKYLNSFSKNHEDQIIREYAKALIDIRQELADNYERYGPLTIQEMNKYNRLEKLEKSILTEMSSLTDITKLKIKSAAEESYQSAYYRTAHEVQAELGANMNFFSLSSEQVQAAIDNPMDRYGTGKEEDSLGFLMRHEANVDQLTNQLKSTITQSIIRGESYEQAARKVTERMNIGVNSAMRITRTEMHRCQITGLRDALMFAGRREVMPKMVTTAYYDSRRDKYYTVKQAMFIKKYNPTKFDYLREFKTYPLESMTIKTAGAELSAKEYIGNFSFSEAMKNLDPDHPYYSTEHSMSAEPQSVNIRMVWHSAMDERVRAEHGYMDQRLSDEDGMFDFPGVGKVESPGMTGVAEHDINCRCSLVGEIPGLEPLKRRLGTGEVVDHLSYEEYANKRGWPIFDPDKQKPKPKGDKPEPKLKPGQYMTVADAMTEDRSKYVDYNDISIYDIEREHEEWINEIVNDRTDRGVTTYTGSSYRKMNNFLRKGSPIDDDRYDAIQRAERAMNTAIVDEPRSVWRGCDYSTLSKMIHDNGGNPKTIEGLVIEDKGFMSTTVRKKEAWGGEFLMKVNCPTMSKGGYVDSISNHRGELEFLLQRGTKMTVVECKEYEDSGRYEYYIELTIVEQVTSKDFHPDR